MRLKKPPLMLAFLLVVFCLPGCNPATGEPEPTLDAMFTDKPDFLPVVINTQLPGKGGGLPTTLVAPGRPTPEGPRPTFTPKSGMLPTPTITNFFAGSLARVEEGVWDLNDKGGLGVVVDAFVTEYGYQLVIVTGGGIIWYNDHEQGFEAVFASPVDELFSNNITTRTSDFNVVLANYQKGESGDVTLWQVSSDGIASMVKQMKEPILRVGSLTFSPDGKKMAVGYNNGVIRIFDTQDGALLNSNEAHKDEVTGLKISYDNRFLVSDSWSNDPNTHVFDIESGEKVATLSLEGYEPGYLSFSTDGSLVSTTSFDGTHIFRTSDWRETGVTIPSVWEAKFTINSGLMMVWHGTGFSDLYSTLTGQKVATIDASPLYCFHRWRLEGNTWVLAELEVDGSRNIVTMYSYTP